MTLDAMHWVWNHSRSKGNTRIALLYVADQVRTSECEVRLGRASFMRFMNAAKNTVKEAIDEAEKLGELVVLEPAVGRRAALYRLPLAVNHARRGSDPDPQEIRRGSEVDPLQAETPSRRGSEVDPQESVEGQFSTARGSKVDPPPHNPKEQAGNEGPRPDAFTRCQPLIKAVTEAGITVSWQMKPSDWLEIAAIVDRAGVDAMVRFAVDTKATARQPIRYATFFLRGGWKGLPPATRNVPTPRPATGAKPPYCGDPDCDEISRTREVEDARGIRDLIPCPNCHPTRKGHAA